jgi:hypothetical protein
LWSFAKDTHPVWFMLEVKRCLKLFLQVLCATPAWPASLVKSSAWPVWPVITTGLTSGTLSDQVFGEKEFNLVVTPIHPPLGDINILSISPLISWLIRLLIRFYPCQNQFFVALPCRCINYYPLHSPLPCNVNFCSATTWHKTMCLSFGCQGHCNLRLLIHPPRLCVLNHLEVSMFVIPKFVQPHEASDCAPHQLFAIYLVFLAYHRSSSYYY